MKYQFDVTLRIPVIVREDSQKAVEERLEHVASTMLIGSPLAEEYPDINYDDSKPSHGKLTYMIFCAFKLSVESNGLENAGSNVPRKIWELVAGSPLAEKTFNMDIELSDEQPGLDELLEWIDNDQPFCVQEPGERYHYECAVTIFGQKAVDREENELIVIFGREWEDDVREAFAHKEEIYASCGYCRGSLYDAPKEIA